MMMMLLIMMMMMMPVLLITSMMMILMIVIIMSIKLGRNPYQVAREADGVAGSCWEQRTSWMAPLSGSRT